METQDGGGLGGLPKISRTTHLKPLTMNHDTYSTIDIENVNNAAMPYGQSFYKV